MIALFFIGGALFFSFHFIYKAYLNYQARQVNLYYPEFSQEEPSLAFQEIKNQEETLLQKKIEEEKKLLPEITEVPFDEREYSESDDIILNNKKLPHSLEQAGSMVSQFEEKHQDMVKGLSKGGHPSYRILMTSFEMDRIKNLMSEYIKKYGALKADRVEPGQNIPGGAYYHLYVSNSVAREFIQNITKLDKAKIYLSNDKRPAPEGKTRVFLWVKNL